MTLVRKNHGRNHSYVLDGVKGRGVTTILGNTLPKPALINWAGNTTAEYAVDNWAELSELPVSKRTARLKRARFDDRDTAANRGTEVHKLAELLVHGLEVEPPEELAGHVDSYVDFLNTCEPIPILTEAVIANRQVWYCGTLDLVADIAGTRWLLDVKTNRSGIFGETALQLAAYANAEVYLADDDTEKPMADLGIQRHGAIWVRADGWDLTPLVVDDAWTVFRHLAWLDRQYSDTDDMRQWVEPSLQPQDIR